MLEAVFRSGVQPFERFEPLEISQSIAIEEDRRLSPARVGLAMLLHWQQR
jgi:hypothetical protein